MASILPAGFLLTQLNNADGLSAITKSSGTCLGRAGPQCRRFFHLNTAKCLPLIWRHKIEARSPGYLRASATVFFCKTNKEGLISLIAILARTDIILPLSYSFSKPLSKKYCSTSRRELSSTTVSSLVGVDPSSGLSPASDSAVSTTAFGCQRICFFILSSHS